MILQLVCKNLIGEQHEEYKSTEEKDISKENNKRFKQLLLLESSFIKFEIKMLEQCICINKPLFEESTM